MVYKRARHQKNIAKTKKHSRMGADTRNTMSILSTIGNLASTEEALETTSVLAGAGAGVALYSAAGLILPLAIAGGVTAAGVVGYGYWQAAKDHSDKLQAVIHGHPIDLPGSGYSDSLPDHDYDFDTALPLWFNQFLDDKGLTSNVTLVASSLGGPISQSLAVDNPRIARIILFDSMEPRGKPTDVSWLQEQFAGPYLIGNDNTREEVRERQQARMGYSREEIELIKDPDEMERRRILKSRLTQPTLVVQSEWDGFVPEETGHALDHEIPHSELLVIPHNNVPTAGHTLMSDTPALAIKIIDDYLQGHPELNRVTDETSYLVYEGDQYHRISTV
ncbi:MAG: hypothetical protein A3G32_00265 [Deltaproteobacteria bacterium RIFCSPLOWO2_12_FULL_40_28]|nr:MAG: hypothetical protein A3C45_03420 [Deltaproteobacteria bacterium RIFCSPHIGHO2_02_FULL_40_28]OGQ19157.1 MAG: hypothetical protein A3E27_02305 [Deltaproteobacteria bacterium RIFCSPHIGHO2_12_FULL_40_32]OGQ39773.1 MAG: hypothetical protein A3I69_07380 [Deltaproteobacteria bacterium RIFCSPLOWO2_02_FULL_40_36]OGQ53609.1 MAG: hypothetical protein A3G32_00265 [Deltaproteobacteria bacterium RIFCSPLOWO2_12_FULL_40_28]